MGNGLDINESEFLKMNTKSRDLLIFRNTVVIRRQQGQYKLHKKLQYYWLGGLTAIIMTILGVMING